MEISGAILINGVQVIGKFDKANPVLPGTYKAEDVLEIRVAPPRAEGQPARVFFAPLSQFAKNGKIEVVQFNVTAFFEPEDEITAGYRQMTSKIIAPNPGGIVTA